MVEHLPSIQSPGFKLAYQVKMYNPNPSTWEVEARDQKLKVSLSYPRELEDSLGMRSSFQGGKTKSKQNKHPKGLEMLASITRHWASITKTKPFLHIHFD